MGHEDRRQPTRTQQLKDYAIIGSSMVTTAVILPTVAWLLLATSEVQRSIVELRKDVAVIQRDIVDHNLNSRTDMKDCADMHHRENILPCNGCHSGRNNK